MAVDYNDVLQKLLAQQDEAYGAYKSANDGAAKLTIDQLSRGANTLATNAATQKTEAGNLYAGQQKTLPSQLAKLGLRGTGAAEGSAVAMGNIYRGSINNINAQTAQSLKEMELAKADAGAQSNIKAQEYYAQLLASRPDLYLQTVNAQQAQLNADRALKNDLALKLAKKGQYAMVEVLGYSKAEIEAMKKKLKKIKI